MKKTKVVMIKGVDEVGEIGECVTVSRGYARNYLIPRGYALSDSKYARDFIRNRHRAISRIRIQRKEQAEECKERIEQGPITIQVRSAESGKLFGAITTRTLVEELAKIDVHIDAKAIHIPNKKINTVGSHDITIDLYEGVSATLQLQVEHQE